MLVCLKAIKVNCSLLNKAQIRFHCQSISLQETSNTLTLWTMSFSDIKRLTDAQECLASHWPEAAPPDPADPPAVGGGGGDGRARS